MDKISHICGAYLSFATQEHMDALKIQGKLNGIKFCKSTFQRNDFSDAKYRTSRFNLNKPYASRESLVSHFLTTKSKAMFLQSPYPEHYPDWLNGLDREISFAYAGYAIFLNDYYPGTYGSPIVQKSKYLLAGSQDELNGYRAVAQSDAVVLLTGNPLMFQLRKKIAENQERSKRSVRILWAPHWTESSEGFGRWEVALEAMHIFARKNPDKEIVFRPHPLLRAAIEVELGEEKSLRNRESIKTSESDSFKIFIEGLREFFKLKNVKMSKHTMLQDVYRSDLLITEGISIIAYWATTGKPILVVRDFRSPKFSTEGEMLLTKIEQTDNAAQILNWLNSRSSFIDVNKELIALSGSIHPTFNKNPLEMIFEYM